jgi:DNA (cytosine-5)-methyltransferase 1
MSDKSVMKKATKPKLRCVDLFAGAGGFSLAALNEGYEVVAAIELNANACKTYAANIKALQPSVSVYERDIMELNPSAFAKEINDAGGCDVMLGGPPCQGFSVHRIKDSGVDDPRNQLLLRYFEFVKQLKPKVFLLENVPGILWKRHESYLKEFYKQAERAGYLLRSEVVLDARNFGLPQRRKRVFILGVRKDVRQRIVWPPKPTHGDEGARTIDSSLLPWVPCGKEIKKPAPPKDPNDVHMNHSPELVKWFMATPPNGGSRLESGRTLPCHENHDGHKDVYGRIDPSKPAPTMTTACINPSKGRFVHPTEHHGITVRQAARIQTFPDNFVFHGGLIAAGTQIGNAVPVKLGEVLLRTIRESLEAKET